VFDRLKLPVHDRLGPSQYGIGKRFNQHSNQLDWSSEPVRPAGQEFMLQNSSTEGEEKMDQSVPAGEDAQSSVAKVIKIGNNDVVMGNCFKGSVIINGSTQA
jgi:hypothetical protein